MQNAIADALAAVEATAAADAAVIERLTVATTLDQVARLRLAARIGDGPAPPRSRAPSDELWRAIHALEAQLRVEHDDVYAGRHVDDEILVRVGLVDRVGAITPRLRRAFAFPSRLHVFAADFSRARRPRSRGAAQSGGDRSRARRGAARRVPPRALWADGRGRAR